MEPLDGRIPTDLAKIGFCGLAYFAVLTNRSIIRPRLQSNLYDKVSLHAEHILTHFALAMGCDGSFEILGMNDSIPLPFSLSRTTFAAITSWIPGFGSEVISPEKPQWDQLLSNTIGSFAYALIGFVQ